MYAKLTMEELEALRTKMKHACSDKRRTEEVFGEGWEVRFDILREMTSRHLFANEELWRSQ